MAVSAKNQKVQKVQGEKLLTPMRRSTSNSTFSSKSAEVHCRKNKDVELSKLVQNGPLSNGFVVFQPLNSTMQKTTTSGKKTITRRGLEPNPSVWRAPKKAEKKCNMEDAHGAADIFVLTGPSAIQTLPHNESKPALKTAPLTQFLNNNQVKRAESSRMLVTVNVSGSTGPLRFLVDVKDHVSRVIELALRAYAREGRLPHLGFNCKNVELYLNNANFEALDPLEFVGSLGTRHFLLHRKRDGAQSDEVADKIDRTGTLPWKAMWNVMMNNIICSH